MKKVMSILCAATVVTALGGCAGGYYSSHGGGAVAVDFDGYYDDYYGPYYDGYWGPDGSFMYSTGRGHPFVRDEAGHFSRTHGGAGWHGIHSHAAAEHRR